MWHRLFKFAFAIFLLPTCLGAILGFYETIVVGDNFFLSQWPFLCVSIAPLGFPVVPEV